MLVSQMTKEHLKMQLTAQQNCKMQNRLHQGDRTAERVLYSRSQDLSQRQSKIHWSDSEKILQANRILQRASLKYPPPSVPCIYREPWGQPQSSTKSSLEQGVNKTQSDNIHLRNRSGLWNDDFFNHGRENYGSQPIKRMRDLSDNLRMNEVNDRRHGQPELFQSQAPNSVKRNPSQSISRNPASTYKEEPNSLKRKISGPISDRPSKSKLPMQGNIRGNERFFDTCENGSFNGNKMRRTEHKSKVIIDLTDGEDDNGHSEALNPNFWRSGSAQHMSQPFLGKISSSHGLQTQVKSRNPVTYKQHDTQTSTHRPAYSESKAVQDSREQRSYLSQHVKEGEAAYQDFRDVTLKHEKLRTQSRDDARSQLLTRGVILNRESCEMPTPKKKLQRRDCDSNAMSNPSRNERSSRQFHYQVEEMIEGEMSDDTVAHDQEQFETQSRSSDEDFHKNRPKSFATKRHTPAPDVFLRHSNTNEARIKPSGNSADTSFNEASLRSSHEGELTRRRRMAQNGEPFSDEWDDGSPLNNFSMAKTVQSRPKRKKEESYQPAISCGTTDIPRRPMHNIETPRTQKSLNMSRSENDIMLPISQSQPSSRKKVEQRQRELEKVPATSSRGNAKVDAIIHTGRTKMSNVGREFYIPDGNTDSANTNPNNFQSVIVSEAIGGREIMRNGSVDPEVAFVNLRNKEVQVRDQRSGQVERLRNIETSKEHHVPEQELLHQYKSYSNTSRSVTTVSKNQSAENVEEEKTKKMKAEKRVVQTADALKAGRGQGHVKSGGYKISVLASQPSAAAEIVNMSTSPSLGCHSPGQKRPRYFNKTGHSQQSNTVQYSGEFDQHREFTGDDRIAREDGVRNEHLMGIKMPRTENTNNQPRMAKLTHAEAALGLPLRDDRDVTAAAVPPPASEDAITTVLPPLDIYETEQVRWIQESRKEIDIPHGRAEVMSECSKLVPDSTPAKESLNFAERKRVASECFPRVPNEIGQKLVETAQDTPDPSFEGGDLFVADDLPNASRNISSQMGLASNRTPETDPTKPLVSPAASANGQTYTAALASRDAKKSGTRDHVSKSRPFASKSSSGVLERLKKDVAKRLINISPMSHQILGNDTTPLVQKTTQLATPNQLLTQVALTKIDRDLGLLKKLNHDISSTASSHGSSTRPIGTAVDRLSAEDAFLLILARQVPNITWQDLGTCWRRVCLRDNNVKYLQSRYWKLKKRLSHDSEASNADPNLETVLYAKAAHLLKRFSKLGDSIEVGNEVENATAITSTNAGCNVSPCEPSLASVTTNEDENEISTASLETLNASTSAMAAPRPTTGGKSLTPDQIATIYAGIQESTDSESELEIELESCDDAEGRESSPLDQEYRCHFIYHVYRRECAALEKLEEQDFMPCGPDYVDIGDANEAATAEFLRERVSSHKWPLVKWQSETDEHYMIHHKGTSMDGASLEVRVDRSLGLWVEGVPAELKRGTVSRKVYDIWTKKTITVRVDNPPVHEAKAESEPGPLPKQNVVNVSPVDNETDIDALFEDVAASTPPSPPALASSSSTTTVVTFQPPTSLHTTVDQANRAAAALVIALKFPLAVQSSRENMDDVDAGASGSTPSHHSSQQLSPRMIERKHAAEQQMAARLDELEASNGAFSDRVVIGNQMTEVWVVPRMLEGPRNI